MHTIRTRLRKITIAKAEEDCPKSFVRHPITFTTDILGQPIIQKSKYSTYIFKNLMPRLPYVILFFVLFVLHVLYTEGLLSGDHATAGVCLEGFKAHKI